MNINIIEMTAADYGEVPALWREVEGLGLHVDECDSREGVARYLRLNPGTSFVARDAGRLVGAVLCGSDGRRGYLHHLAVAPASRRMGVATALVRRCLDSLAAMRIAKCNLFVFADNDDAMAFWKGIGWRCWDETGLTGMSILMATASSPRAQRSL